MTPRHALGYLAGSAIALVAACAGGAHDVASPKAEANLAARGRALERGTGTARDYRAAAELYRAACDDSRGSAAACGAFIRAQLRGRGVALDERAARALAGKLCVAQRDPFGCLIAAQATDATALAEPLHDTSMAVLAELAPCDAQHLSACYARAWGDGVDDRRARSRPRREALALCRADIVASCAALVEELDTAAPSHAEAARRLQAACDLGDAEACAAAPSRTPISNATLCAAADYAACAMQGCEGDAAAFARATSHGIPKNACDGFRPRARTAGPHDVDAIAQMTTFRDRVCACRDQACANLVLEARSQWEDARRAAGTSQLSMEASGAVAALDAALVTCLQKIMAATAAP